MDLPPTLPFRPGSCLASDNRTHSRGLQTAFGQVVGAREQPLAVTPRSLKRALGLG